MLGSLTNRIFLACALLAVVSTATAIILVRAMVIREAEMGLQRGLNEAGALVTEWRTILSENFQLAARVIADAPPLKAAVDTGDPATVAPLVATYHEQIRSAAMFVTDGHGRVLAEAGPWLPDRAETSKPATQALGGREAVSYWPHPEGVLQLVTVPISAPPQIIGTLSVGFLFDSQRAEQFRRLTESEVALVLNGRVRASTLPASASPAVSNLLERPGVSRLTLGEEEYMALVRPLTAAGGGEPVAVILQSRTQRLRFLEALNTALGVTALAAVLGAIVLGYLVARTITRPLAAITRGMREVAATGDLTRKIALPAGNWEDEDARLLANTFNTLTDSISQFQREAAQRERLSSLGRMSSVVAHEIRNPLMIIKAAIRPLRKESPPAEVVAEAAKDIGEEVDRLNRIVGEVLDLARPIQFDLALTDLAAVCRQAAAAVTAGDPDPPVHLSVPDTGPVMLTDSERLRAVLVNLLTNARQAVLDARGEAVSAGVTTSRDPADPDIELTLTAGSDSATIEVRDYGKGIPPAHAARLFEPYYTTRRGGTGLGLAISRNIIDGLGGTITIESAGGPGTRVRVELPARPRASMQKS